MQVILCVLLLLNVCFPQLPSISLPLVAAGRHDDREVPSPVELTAVAVIEGPSRSADTKCAPENRITDEFYVTMHYNATIDSTSKTGKKGKMVDSTHPSRTKYPSPIMVHMSDYKDDPLLGWVKGLRGFCAGDRVLLIVPPDLAYGDAGDGGSIPGGATLALHIYIVTAHADPEDHHRANQVLNADKLYQEMDSDGDGKVTLEEMEIYLDVPNDYPNRENFIRQHFLVSDYNKDGSVSLEEFKAILENYQGIDEL